MTIGGKARLSAGRERLFEGGGEMAARMAALDWTSTPLGPTANWSPALRMIVKFLLANRFPQLLWWGPEFCSIYNDAYIPILGTKHPWALGRPVREVWNEIWQVLKPLIETPFSGGPATWMEDIPLEINRRGFFEETHFTIAYSPVPDESIPGAIGGVLATVHEITEKVVGERRVRALRDLGARSVEPKSAEEACIIVREALSQHSKDIPFLLLYLLDEKRRNAKLACRIGTDQEDRGCPGLLDLGSRTEEEVWPLSDVLATEDIQLVEDLTSKFDRVPQGPWSDAPTRAVVLPIRSNLQHQLAGFMVAGLSSRLEFDKSYRDFLELMSTQVATTVANACAYEEERKRAEALAELDRAKTKFFSNVSHEFRTPLTLMLGPLTDILMQQSGSLPAQVSEELGVVHRNGLRLLKLVNSLLDFSRIEAGRVKAAFEPTDLARYTAELASVFRSAVDKAGLTLVVDTPRLPEPAYIDRDMWEKIVLNLMSNAFKFTFTGGITVRLTAGGPMIRLSVADSGSGIPSDELPRLFERFHRVESTRGRTHEGTGIGLALVQELVKIHGGKVSVESEVGKGTTLTVEIPAGKDHLPPERISTGRTQVSTSVASNAVVEEMLSWLPGAAAPQGFSSELGKTQSSDAGSIFVKREAAPAAKRPRVLLADDNADMRAYLARLLSERYDVVAVADGEAALKAARSHVPALIVSDVMMPNVDGFGLLEAVRSDTPLAGVPVILLSARAGEEATLEGVKAGANDYLVKPFSARELLARVDAQIERRLFERQLANAEQRLHSALAAARMVAWEWDLAADRVTTSETANDVFGLAAGQGMPSAAFGFTLVHPEDRERYRATVEAAAKRKEGYHTEFRIVRPVDNKVAWLEERSQAVTDPESRETRLVGLVMDITERKLIEQRREQTLEAERSAREEAQRVSRMKDEFLATLSHELRTPLNAILGWSQILNRGSHASDDAKRGLDAIERNARLQTQLIEDLLDMSRIISGRIRLDVQRLELADVVATVAQSVRPQASARGVRLITVLDPSAGPVAGDASRLHQVLWNLLSNAIKFTPRGGKVQVVLERVNSYLELSVADTGEGIAPEFLPHVFERFRQADASTTRTHSGLGLGLSIVKHLVELHGGTVRAESPGKGHGSTFTVALPLAATSLPSGIANADRQHPRIPSAEPIRIDSPSLAGLSILVVDDDPDACEVLQRILAGTGGATVVTACSAAEALAAIEKSPPDVVVSDIGMPHEDGYEFIRKVRALPPDRGGMAPAVALTAFARSEDRQRALLAGYQIHVAKPVDPSELITVCASVMRSRA
jgi:PAS domain S-box-containing protein